METDPTQFAAGLGSSLFGSLTVIRFIIGMVFYFLPTLIARERDFAMKGWLFWTNLFLGWTVLGWGICLLWAACATSFEQDAYYARQIREAAARDYAREDALRRA